MRSFCFDCEKVQDIDKVFCEKHTDGYNTCEDYCYECAECGTLNVKCQV